MKYEAKSRGLRADLSVSELGKIVSALEHSGESELLVQMRGALHEQSSYASEQRQRRAHRRSRSEPPSVDRDRITEVDGYTVFANACDAIDMSRDPDVRKWLPIDHRSINLPQAEVRRDVLNVSIFLQPGLHFLSSAILIDDTDVPTFARGLIAAATASGHLRDRRAFHYGDEL